MLLPDCNHTQAAGKLLSPHTSSIIKDGASLLPCSFQPLLQAPAILPPRIALKRVLTLWTAKAFWGSLPPLPGISTHLLSEQIHLFSLCLLSPCIQSAAIHPSFLLLLSCALFLNFHAVTRITEHDACSSPLTTLVVPHEVSHSPGPIHQPCSFPSSASMTFQPCSHSLLPPSCLSNTPPAYGAVSVPGHDTFTPQIHHRKAAASTEHAVEDADRLFIRKLQTELWETQQSGFTHGGISESLSF